MGIGDVSVNGLLLIDSLPNRVAERIRCIQRVRTGFIVKDTSESITLYPLDFLFDKVNAVKVVAAGGIGAGSGMIGIDDGAISSTSGHPGGGGAIHGNAHNEF